MTPISLAGPAVEPVTLADAKAYLRLDSTDEDDLVSALIAAGRLTVERATRLCLVEQGWRVRLDRWPVSRAVPLPLAPLISVDAVRLVEDGVPSPVAAGAWRLEGAPDMPRLLVLPGVADPVSAGGCIEIDLTAGFGSSPATVPEPLRLAVRRLVAGWFETRGDAPRPGPSGLPVDVRALLAPFVRPRLA